MGRVPTYDGYIASRAIECFVEDGVNATGFTTAYDIPSVITVNDMQEFLEEFYGAGDDVTEVRGIPARDFDIIRYRTMTRCELGSITLSCLNRPSMKVNVGAGTYQSCRNCALRYNLTGIPVRSMVKYAAVHSASYANLFRINERVFLYKHGITPNPLLDRKLEPNNYIDRSPDSFRDLVALALSVMKYPQELLLSGRTTRDKFDNFMNVYMKVNGAVTGLPLIGRRDVYPLQFIDNAHYDDRMEYTIARNSEINDLAKVVWRTSADVGDVILNINRVALETIIRLPQYAAITAMYALVKTLTVSWKAILAKASQDGAVPATMSDQLVFMTHMDQARFLSLRMDVLGQNVPITSLVSYWASNVGYQVTKRTHMYIENDDLDTVITLMDGARGDPPYTAMVLGDSAFLSSLYSNFYSKNTYVRFAGDMSNTRVIACCNRSVPMHALFVALPQVPDPESDP
jgi:hypothetical protein